MGKVLHISLGKKNTALYAALESIADEYKQIDWVEFRSDINRHILSWAAVWKPDLTFFHIQEEDVIEEDTLKKLSGVKINWTGDVRSPLPKWYTDLAPYFHVTLFTNMVDVRAMRKLGFNADYLQVGYEDSIYKPEGDVYMSPEIVFMGNNYKGAFPLSGKRTEMVVELRKKYGKRFQVYGNNWGDALQYNGVPLIEAGTYRGCKIAINQNHFNYERFSSDRIFRIMACGAFCISNHFKGIEKEFEIGKHLETFKTIPELKKKIDLYLNDDKKREKIAKAGCDLVRKKYTWQGRMKELKKIIRVYGK